MLPRCKLIAHVAIIRPDVWNYTVIDTVVEAVVLHVVYEPQIPT